LRAGLVPHSASGKTRHRRSPADRIAAVKHFLLAALQDFALHVHLTQATLGVIERRSKYENVVDALARFGADVETVSNHDAPSFSHFRRHPFERQGLSAEDCYHRSTLARKHPFAGHFQETGPLPTVPSAEILSEPARLELGPVLSRMGIVSAHTNIVPFPLSGGVSSEIFRIDLPTGPICVKRALPKLKVAADWRVPVERNRSEVEWMRVAAGIEPAAVPKILGEDRATGCFAMAYLPPDGYPVWKDLLRAGIVELPTAAAIGDTLGLIHAATADRAEVAARFDTDELFHALRLEPYLEATARKHIDLEPRLTALAETTRTTKRVLVHGDFSPKNLLIGPAGPVILDAECAWYGDPAFDLAFVLNHLLLKGAWQPQWRGRYCEAFAALTTAYLSHVAWELPAACEARAAALLPALMLARIDGKSPVEYLTDESQQDAVRCFARSLIVDPLPRVGEIGQRWLEEVTA
jgi:aminoglycoside phosphotransferase (APT) family kinase protein